MADKDVTESNQSEALARPEEDAPESLRPRKKDADSEGSAAKALADPDAPVSLRPKKKSAPVALVEPDKKGRPSKRTEPAHDDPFARKVGPKTFVDQSVAELKKVVWPTGDQLRQYFIVVLVFVVLVIAYVSGLDAAFGWLLLKLLG